MLKVPLALGFWRNLPIAAKSLIAVSGPLLVLAAGYELFSGSVTDENRTRRHLVQTIQEQESLDRLLQHLLAMESAIRSYLLSYEPDFRLRYLDKRHQTLQELEDYDQIRTQNGNGNQEISKLRNRVAEKLAVTEELASVRTTSISAMDPLIQRSAATMEKVEQSIGSLKDEQRHLVAADLQTLEDFHRKTVVAGLLAIGLGALLSGASVFLFSNALARRLQALQVDVRAIKNEAPLEVDDPCEDELGLLRSELQTTSEKLASRVFTLRESESHLKAIFDNTDAVMYLKDLESRFLLINHAYEKRIGLTPDRAIGRGPVELFGRETGEKLRANDLKVFESEHPMQFEESVVLNGKRLRYLSLKTPLRDSNGKVCGLCGVSTDITDLNSTGKGGNDSASRSVAGKACENGHGYLPLGQQQTVLIVEDEDAVAQMEALLLRTLGYKVLVAEDAERAERIAASSPVDLVMADYRLPQMSGLELIQRLGQRNPKSKAILVSGDVIDAPGAGGLPMLHKPFEIRELARSVHSALN